MKKYFLFLAVFLSLVVASCTNNDFSSKSFSEEDYVRISLSDIDTNMQKFTYDEEGVEIRYFAVLGSDGLVRTAFDACDVCGGHNGYSQDNDKVICNTCGLSFEIDKIGVENKGGGCWPSYLEHETEEEYILIKKQNLKSGSFRFV
jgi:uncharacterized membrane protein